MKVKITCAGSSSWYRNMIGYQFEVEETKNKYKFKVCGENLFILRCHCIW